MKPFKPNTRGNNRGPEAKIQGRIVNMLERRGWFVKATHGSAFQSGFPDLHASHRTHGVRWIEVKNPICWVLTAAQMWDYPLMIENGCPIWVMIDATELEYAKLFRECNYHDYHDAGIRGYINIYEYRDDLTADKLRPIEIDVSKLKNLEEEDGEDEEES